MAVPLLQWFNSHKYQEALLWAEAVVVWAIIVMKEIQNKLEALGIEANTPLAMMTIGQLMEILSGSEPVSKFNPSPEKRYVYGLRGIKELFHVSIRTAQIWKDTIIKEAVYQNGRTIVVDAEKALKLFNERRNGYGRI